jgi:hypothetical protein
MFFNTRARRTPNLDDFIPEWLRILIHWGGENMVILPSQIAMDITLDGS